MAKTLRITHVAAAVVLAGAMAAHGARAQGMGHEGHAGMGHGSAAAATPQPQGMLVRESNVQGYSFSYRLFTWDERNIMMKGMEGHEMPGMDTSGRSSHHLMVFVRDAAGKDVAGAKVGFIVTGPDKAEFKTLTMAMNGGYGADIPLKARGTHILKTKVVIGDRTLNEEFSYDVK